VTLICCVMDRSVPTTLHPRKFTRFSSETFGKLRSISLSSSSSQIAPSRVAVTQEFVARGCSCSFFSAFLSVICLARSFVGTRRAICSRFCQIVALQSKTQFQLQSQIDANPREAKITRANAIALNAREPGGVARAHSGFKQSTPALKNRPMTLCRDLSAIPRQDQ